MNHRERARIALTGGQPDYVPHFELGFEETERDFEGRTFYGSSCEPQDAERSRLEKLQYNAQLHVDIARRFEQSIILLGPFDWPLYDHYQDVVDLIKVVREISGDELCVMGHGDPTFSIPGDPTWMVELAHDNPDELKRQAQWGLDSMLEIYTEYMDAGADGAIMCSDYAFNSGTFFSPEQFGDFVTPYLVQAVQGIKDRGGLAIKHTDGNLMEVMDQLMQAAPHALHSIDPMAGMDIRQIKHDYGDKIALCGNVHCAHLQTGTPEQIRESAEYCMEHAKPGGGYLFSTSNCVFRGMPLESYDLIHGVWREMRSYEE